MPSIADRTVAAYVKGRVGLPIDASASDFKRRVDDLRARGILEDLVGGLPVSYRIHVCDACTDVTLYDGGDKPLAIGRFVDDEMTMITSELDAHVASHEPSGQNPRTSAFLLTKSKS